MLSQELQNTKLNLESQKTEFQQMITQMRDDFKEEKSYLQQQYDS